MKLKSNSKEKRDYSSLKDFLIYWIYGFKNYSKEYYKPEATLVWLPIVFGVLVFQFILF